VAWFLKIEKKNTYASLANLTLSLSLSTGAPKGRPLFFSGGGAATAADGVMATRHAGACSPHRGRCGAATRHVRAS
jgi:hypothetical protein